MMSHFLAPDKLRNVVSEDKGLRDTLRETKVVGLGRAAPCLLKLSLSINDHARDV